MNKQEAKELIRNELDDYQKKTYTELVRLINEEIVYERKGASGTTYQIEILITWELGAEGAILVIGSIDDGGWHAFSPITESFLRYPDD